ncbi:hypothetical protein DC364_01745 [Vibrio vulnificus]|nr:hypothetical protein [Vibrio vulnificus]PVA00174.1 hypothetical protein DC364_01745 [Vibrio vulnificus]
MNKAKNILNNKLLISAVALTSGSAFADNTAAITEAVTGGKAMVELTTSGVIGIAALGFGLGMVVSWLRK